MAGEVSCHHGRGWGRIANEIAVCRRIMGMSAAPINVNEIQHPGERLSTRVHAFSAPICVGLDPVIERMPEVLSASPPLEAMSLFCDGVLDAIEGIVPCIKIQSACFERFGASGVALLERTMNSAIGKDFEVILDAKRGDIGITAEHYAESARSLGAHWVTVNGYLGEDGIRPFLDVGMGVFVLVRTSNPSGDEIQNVEVRDGGTVAGKVAEMVARLGDEYSESESMHSVGAVVGATKPEAAKQLRELMPHQPFLLPGFGAQGGGVEGVHAALDAARGGVLVTSSRGIIYPPHTDVSSEGADPQDWGGRIKAAAQSFAHTICSVVGGDES